MAKYSIHKANSRGDANHGWLHSKHTFSFANYYEPSRMNFGALRVLNDDYVDPGMGFGKHPHSNMEIITIPLEGELAHEDSMGNGSVIRKGDIQVMSAGTGIAHSEYNHSKTEPVKFLQIWVIPNQEGVTPRYDQKTINYDLAKDNFLQILSPDAVDDGVWIYQNAWFHLSEFSAGTAKTYSLKLANNGVYIFVLSGDVTVDGHELSTRDGLGITNASQIQIQANTNAEFLIMEVPL
ncbi:pirin family protein [Sphingobacterium sp. HJSM2_6]|uniref:pirin family protein n=1 Tax=Sphingobacterium sp. HJSM2_6 TaxID=3366264 RepID=UPI003BC70978